MKRSYYIGTYQLVRTVEDQMIRWELIKILQQKPEESEAAVNIGQVESVDQTSVGTLLSLATCGLGKNEFLPSVSIIFYRVNLIQSRII